MSIELRRRCESVLLMVPAERLQQLERILCAAAKRVDDSQPVAVAATPYKDFGMELRRLRIARGWSLSDLAKLTYCDRRTLGNIETGARRPSRTVAQACDRALGADGVLRELMTVHTRSRDRNTPMVNRRQMLSLGMAAMSVPLDATVAPHAGDPEHLVVMFGRLRMLCQQVSPHAVLPMLQRQTEELHRLARSDRRGPRRKHQQLAGHFSMYVGKMFQEAGNLRLARFWTDRAAYWAATAADPLLEASVDVRRAMLALYQGDRHETIGLARRAQRVGGAPPRILGVAAMREALGHARTPDGRSDCWRSLDRAAELLAVNDPPPTDAAELEASNVADPLAITTAWCYHDLGNPRKAAELLDLEMTRIPSGARRTHVRFGTRRALAYACIGEVEHACLLAQRLLPAVKDVASTTIAQDLRQLKRLLSLRHTNPTVRELLPEINAVLVTATQR